MIAIYVDKLFPKLLSLISYLFGQIKSHKQHFVDETFCPEKIHPQSFVPKDFVPKYFTDEKISPQS